MNMHALLREGSPYVVSGLLMLSGIVFAFVRDVPRRIGSAFARRFIASVTISNGNSIYYWARIWLDRHPYSHRAKNFTAKTVSSSDESDHGKGGFILTPAFGEHLMRHRGRFVWFERWQENAVDPDRGRRLERMTFRMLGGSRADIERLLDDMAEAARALEKRRTRIFINGARGWSEVATRDRLSRWYWSKAFSRKRSPTYGTFAILARGIVTWAFRIVAVCCCTVRREPENRASSVRLPAHFKRRCISCHSPAQSSATPTWSSSFTR